jgi:hypothetical protein
MKRCGRTGVRCFTAHDPLTPPRNWNSIMTPPREWNSIMTTPRNETSTSTPPPDWIRIGGRLSRRVRHGGRDGNTLLHNIKCGRGDAGVRSFTVHDRLAAVHDRRGAQ